MDTNTLLIIVVVLLLLFGGGWYGRGCWYLTRLIETSALAQVCLVDDRDIGGSTWTKTASKVRLNRPRAK